MNQHACVSFQHIVVVVVVVVVVQLRLVISVPNLPVLAAFSVLVVVGSTAV